MEQKILYNDSLVEISENLLILKKYYFPSLSSKKISFEQIRSFKVLEPTIPNGKWRIHGSGDLRTWFPMDIKRPKRDKIFWIALKTQWITIGFTVEDSNKVIEVLRMKGILKN